MNNRLAVIAELDQMDSRFRDKMLSSAGQEQLKYAAVAAANALEHLLLQGTCDEAEELMKLIYSAAVLKIGSLLADNAA